MQKNCCGNWVLDIERFQNDILEFIKEPDQTNHIKTPSKGVFHQLLINLHTIISIENNQIHVFYLENESRF
jgi:hypothetical protein